ncbi:hypothetical protein GCM10009557_33680 [Virgisporangium ochraceum]
MTFSSESGLQLALQMINDELGTPVALRRHSAVRAQLFDLVRSLAGTQGGLVSLVTVAERLEPDTNQTRTLRNLLDQWVAAGGATLRVARTADTCGTSGPRGRHRPVVWGNIPPRNPNFTGRHAMLGTLHERLRSGPTALLPEALYGMGGVGKTQLSTEYIYRYQNEYELVWWIPSERPAQIRQALSELAHRLGLPVGAEANAAVPAVREALRAGTPFSEWLLVFDNAESPESVTPFFPTGGPGRILVTSRDSRWASVADTVEVDVFTRAESTELLRRRGPELSIEDADRLAFTLGDLPLAIEQAAAWRSETGMPVNEYLRLLEEKRPELLDDAPPLGYPTTVAAAWNVSLDALRARNAGAMQLLQLCAFLAPEPISRCLLTGSPQIRILPELDETLRDPIQFSRAIREINRHGLARIDHRNDTIQLHRLVQHVLIGQMADDQRKTLRHGVHLLLASSDPDDPDAPANWPRYGELYAHVVASGAFDCGHDPVRRLVLNEALYLFRWGDNDGGIEISQRALEAWRVLLGAEHPQTLGVAARLGFMLFHSARFAEAAALNMQVLDGYRRAFGDEDRGTLGAMQAMAADLRARGDFVAALEVSKTVHRESTRLFGADDPITLRAAHNLGVSLRLVGQFERARTLDEQTFRRMVGIFGEDHLTTYYTHLGLTIDQRELGDYLGARRALEVLVARLQLILGEHNYVTQRAVLTLSVTRRKAGDHQGALECAEAASALSANQYGPHHPETLASHLSLSTARRASGDLHTAWELGRSTYERYVGTLGERHPYTTVAAVNLDSHTLTAACAINLASDLFAKGEIRHAHDLDSANLRRLRTILSDDHPLVLACAINHAIDRRELGHDDEAKQLHLDILERLGRVLGPGHPATQEAAGWTRATCDVDPMPL